MELSCSMQNKARAHSKAPPEAEDPQPGKVTFDVKGCRADLPQAHLFCLQHSPAILFSLPFPWQELCGVAAFSWGPAPQSSC